MTSKQKQNRKDQIKARATAKKVSKQAPPAQAEFDEAKATAYRLENEGKWDEAQIAWGVARDCATKEKDKKQAAGRQAAAKVRASAASQAMEAQMREQAERTDHVRDSREHTATNHDGYAPPPGGDSLPADLQPIVEPTEEQLKHDREDQDAEFAEQDAAEETRASTLEEMAAEAAEVPTANGVSKRKSEPAEAKPRERDPRMPPAGTVLVKRDRTGAERARCVVALDGVEYGGATYKSLSAAGLAAMAALGLKAETCDGYAFWGLKKTASAAKETKDTAKSLLVLAREMLGRFVSDDVEVAALNARIDALLGTATPPAPRSDGQS